MPNQPTGPNLNPWLQESNTAIVLNFIEYYWVWNWYCIRKSIGNILRVYFFSPLLLCFSSIILFHPSIGFFNVLSLWIGINYRILVNFTTFRTQVKTKSRSRQGTVSLLSLDQMHIHIQQTFKQMLQKEHYFITNNFETKKYKY